MTYIQLNSQLYFHVFNSTQLNPANICFIFSLRLYHFLWKWYLGDVQSDVFTFLLYDILFGFLKHIWVNGSTYFIQMCFMYPNLHQLEKEVMFHIK